jgi:hypothetical protein
MEGIQFLTDAKGQKGGKSREIPVRHDLQELIAAYIDAAGLRDAPRDTPLFQSALKKQRRLTGRGTEPPEVIERRLEAAKIELAAEPEFDETLVNTSVKDVARELLALMEVV